MTNIAEILKNAPEGIELYSPVFGEVHFKRVEEGDMILVSVSSNGNDINIRFYNDGRYVDFANADCVLFPSKESANWEAFKNQLKRNVVLTHNSVDETLEEIGKYLCVNGTDYVSLDSDDDITFRINLDVNRLIRDLKKYLNG